MKTKLFSVMAVFAALALTACNGGNASKESKPAGTSNKPTTSQPASKPSSSKPASSSSSQAPAADAWADVASGKTGKWQKQTRAKDNAVGYKALVNDAEGWNSGDVKMNGKTAPNNESSWAVEGLPAGTYEVEFNCLMSYQSHGDRYWYNMAKHGNETATSNPDTEAEDDYRYWIVTYGATGSDPVNVYPDNDKNWSECGLEGSDQGGEYQDCKVITTATIAADTTKVSLKHGNIGYSLIISYVRFIAKAVA